MKRLLLVDDSDFLLFCFTEYLEAHGFVVETARSVRAAMRRLRTFKPDILVLEIGLGEIEGVSLLQHLAGPDGRPRWPVIVHTLRPEMEEFCRSVGVEEFILKTGHGETLLEGIQAVVARRAAAVVEAEPAAEAEPAPMRGMVLLGEDDAGLAAFIVRAFSRSGFAVTVAATGPALLEAAAGAPPLAIVIKEALPGLSGRTVAARLADAEGLRRVPVVIYDDAHDFHDAAGWKKVPRNVKSVLFAHDAELLIDAVEAGAHLKAG